MASASPVCCGPIPCHLTEHPLECIDVDADGGGYPCLPPLLESHNQKRPYLLAPFPSPRHSKCLATTEDEVQHPYQVTHHFWSCLRFAIDLITDPVRPSPFVKELIKNCPQVTVRPGMRPRCPACQEGALIPSQSGDNLRCSNFPTCHHLSPRCPGCRRGYVSLKEDNSAECSNPACDSSPRLCPKCKQGVMLLRTGQSSFWGCSRYGATPSCTHTERAPDKAGPTVTPGSRPASRGQGTQTQQKTKSHPPLTATLLTKPSEPSRHTPISI